MDSSVIKLRKEAIGGVQTNIMQFKGTNPDMPTVFYHPGIFGSLENLVKQNIPRLALESGCSFLALNTIDQNSQGTYPPRNIDFDLCMEIIEQGIDSYVTGSGIIPILNSWGSFPTTLAIQNCFDIKVKGVLGIGATLNAHKVIRAKLEGLFNDGVLSADIKQAFNAGETIQAPFPNGMTVNVNKAFFEAHDGKISTNSTIHVENQIICIRGEDDEYVTDQDTDGITAIYKNTVEADRRPSGGGHWGDKEKPVAIALTEITNSCKLALKVT